jgi:glycosyltransferase involved in cell wall biosynthesis
MEKRVLFVTDHKFVLNDSVIYSEGGITSLSFERYFSLSKKISVLSRHRYETEIDQKRYYLIDVSNVEFVGFNGISWKDIFFKRFFSNFFKTIRLIKKSDILIFRVPSFSGLLTIPIAWAFRKKYIVEVVGDPYEAIYQAIGQGTLKAKLTAKFFHVFFRFFIKRASGGIYVTESILQEKYPCVGKVASASNVEVLVPPDSVIQNRLERKVFEGPVVVGVIGSYFNNYKGIDVLVDAVCLLRTAGHDVILRILGRGDADNVKLKSKYHSIAEYVFFDPPQSKVGVCSWLDDIDIYCQPSRTEGLPRALIEAMSRGLPCIATNVGGIPELLNSRYLVPIDSSDAIADKIQLLIRDFDSRSEAILENFNNSKKYYPENLKKVRADFFGYFKK